MLRIAPQDEARGLARAGFSAGPAVGSILVCEGRSVDRTNRRPHE